MKKKNWFLSSILVLVLIFTFSIPVSAQSSTSIVSATVTNVELVYTITTPDTIGLTTPPSINSAASSAAFSITVYTNDTANPYATIKVYGSDGKLSQAADAHVLSPSLQITNSTLGWTDMNIFTSGSATESSKILVNPDPNQISNIIIKQPKVTSPSLIPAGTYQEDLTFQVTYYSN